MIRMSLQFSVSVHRAELSLGMGWQVRFFSFAASSMSQLFSRNLLVLKSVYAVSKPIKISTLNACGVECLSSSSASQLEQPILLFRHEGIRELRVGVRSMTDSPRRTGLLPAMWSALWSAVSWLAYDRCFVRGWVKAGWGWVEKGVTKSACRAGLVLRPE